MVSDPEDDALDNELPEDYERKEDMAEDPKTELYSPVERPQGDSFAFVSYSMKLYVRFAFVLCGPPS